MIAHTTKFQILSLDGGGIRGLFSAAVLSALEIDLGIKITDHFDLITGTSTGGIIALGLAAGIRPLEIVNFYEEHGTRIFNNSGWLKYIRGFERWFKSPYSPEPLEVALKKVFGNLTLADCSNRVVIPTTNLNDTSVYLFKTPHHTRLRRDWRVPLWKIARSTSAAPTYFPISTHVDDVRLADGGLWANNPMIVAITEAVSMLDIPLSEIKAFSLGTTTSISQRPRKLDRGGLLAWVHPISEVLMEVQSKSAQGLSEHLIGKDNLLRLDPITPKGMFSLDKVDITGLKAWAGSESRKIAPTFEKMFKTHIAAKYEPLYTSKRVY
jgi:uncharacterized protein